MSEFISPQSPNLNDACGGNAFKMLVHESLPTISSIHSEIHSQSRNNHCKKVQLCCKSKKKWAPCGFVSSVDMTPTLHNLRKTESFYPSQWTHPWNLHLQIIHFTTWIALMFDSSLSLFFHQHPILFLETFPCGRNSINLLSFLLLTLSLPKTISLFALSFSLSFSHFPINSIYFICSFNKLAYVPPDPSNLWR